MAHASHSLPSETPPDLDQLRTLRAAALVEATTLLALLCVAVPLRHLGGIPAATAVMGPVHGLAFAAYVWLTIAAVSGGGFTRREAARLLIAAVLPFGGFLCARWLRRHGGTT